MSEIETVVEAPSEVVPAVEVEQTELETAQETIQPNEPVALGDESPSDDNSIESDASDEPKKGRAQLRIEQLSRQKRETDERLRDSEARVALLESQSKESPEEGLVYPQLADFGYDEGQYQEAVGKYHSETMRRQFQQSRSDEMRQESQLAQQEAANVATQTFHARAELFAESKPDFQEKISNPAFVQSPTMMQAIVMAENGPAVAFHLASNLDVGARINAMTPIEQAMELGKLSGRLSAAPSVKTTTTPAPATPVIANGSLGKDPESMSPKEYVAHRQKQMAR